MRLTVLYEDKLPKNAVNVPTVRQQTNYSCGTASVLSVLRYFKLFDGTEKDLYKPLGTNYKNGTEIEDIVKVLKHHGLEAHFKPKVSLSDLKKWLSPTQVAIITIQAWEDEKDPTPLAKSMDDGHYVVFIGFDAKDLYFMDPSMGGKKYGSIPLDELSGRWHDFGKNGKRQDHQTIFIKGEDPTKVKPKERDAKEIE